MPSAPVTVICSSVGTAATVALDWMTGGPASIRLTAPSSTGSAGGTLQVTLHDILTTKASQVVWSGVSSQGATSFLSTAVGAGAVITSSGIVDTQLIYSFTTPLAAVRLNCSAFSSGGIRMDVLQGQA